MLKFNCILNACFVNFFLVMNNFYCNICDIVMDKGVNWASHMVGSKHLAKLANKVPATQLYCNPCRRQLDSSTPYQQGFLTASCSARYCAPTSRSYTSS